MMRKGHVGPFSFGVGKEECFKYGFLVEALYLPPLPELLSASFALGPMAASRVAF